MQLLAGSLFRPFSQKQNSQCDHHDNDNHDYSQKHRETSDFGGEDEVAEGEELAEEEEEGVFEGDGEGVWDPEGEDELEVATTLPFTTLALMNWDVSPEPGAA